MKDGINMGGFAITNLPEPILDSEPATKKWVTADFPTKVQIINGFTMNGILDLGGHSITGVRDPTSASSGDHVTTKKYVNDNFAKLSGFTTQGNINVGGSQSVINTAGNRIINLPEPNTDTEPVTKKYADDNYLAETGTLNEKGFTMAGDIDMGNANHKIINLPEPTLGSEPGTKKWVTDNFVSKTKITTAEWSWWYINVNATFNYPYHQGGWSNSVRTDEITQDTNIEIRNITFDDEVTKAQILASTLVVNMRYDTATGSYNKDIITEPLAGKTILEFPLNAKKTALSKTVLLEEEYWLGNFVPAGTTPLGFSISIKVTGFPPSMIGPVGPEVVCLFRLNESGQFG